jgi:hypothetical protein
MHTRFDVAMVRLLRVGVVALGATVPLVGGVLDQLGHGNRLLASTALWTMWAVALLCILVPASSTLTALRLVAPAHLATLVLVAIAGGIDAATSIALALSAIVTTVAASAEAGAHFIQSSAYGDERRFPLRCPRTFVTVIVLAWIIWFTVTALGFVLLVAGVVVAPLLLALAIAGFALLPRRFHRYSRRWLVSVPAGLVVHDHVLLTETAMFPARLITDVHAWSGSDSPDDEPFDLTGGSPSSGLVVRLSDPETVILAPTKDHPGGQAFHVRSVRIRPSRIGRAVSLLTRS